MNDKRIKRHGRDQIEHADDVSLSVQSGCRGLEFITSVTEYITSDMS